jgi:hypothetical protein
MTEYLVAVKVEDEQAIFSFPSQESQEHFIDSIEDAYDGEVEWMKTVDDEDEDEDEDEDDEEGST